MAAILFPGRHLANTRFQEEYLRAIFAEGPATRCLPERAPPRTTIDTIIFAVTSANQEYSRYNPIPFHVRAIGIDRFAQQLHQQFGIQYRIIGIPHYEPSERFAEMVIKEISEQTEDGLHLTDFFDDHLRKSL